jgi:lysine 6-dehydrogenase
MPNTQLLILGGGMQGKAVLFDTVRTRSFDEIVITDVFPDVMELPQCYPDSKITALQVDASDEAAVRTLMQNADVIIEALPAGFGVRMARIAAHLGKPLVSSVYFVRSEDPETRKHEQDMVQDIAAHAAANGCTILTEFGMDPGLDLMIARQAINEFDHVDTFHSYGAGFPERAACNNPLHYKFAWSVRGVMLSHKRTGTIIRDGAVVIIPSEDMFAVRNTHTIDEEEVGGKLECFVNGDSSRYATLFGVEDTVQDMGRYICRWPGHGAFWWRMSQCGFLNTEPIDVHGSKVVPVDFLVSLLGTQPGFRYNEDERDIVFIRIDVSGSKNGRPKHVRYQLIDFKDLDTNMSAMQRTVGFTMSIGATLIHTGVIAEKGLIYPSSIPVSRIESELATRDITVTRTDTV